MFELHLLMLINAGQLMSDIKIVQCPFLRRHSADGSRKYAINFYLTSLISKLVTG